MTTRRFAPLPADRPPAETEAAVALSWREHKIFEATLEATKGGKPFVFYEGPPTANGMPHHGHVLTRVMKDLFPRYKTMCGFHVERKAGWDTHGLPVEIEVEKVLGLEGKQDIEKYGIAPFIDQCRKSVWKYQAEWEKLTDRIGFWIDMGKPYITYSKDYVESVWWSLKRVHELGLLYKGHKILPWCPRDMTGLSSAEVSEDTYAEINDPAVTVALQLEGDEAALLAWTTTPWTLLSNVALAVHPDVEYAWVRHDGRLFVVAKDRIEAVFGKKADVVRTAPGRTLLGKRYAPLYSFLKLEAPAHVVLDGGSFVTVTDGTGIVHMAPAYGEDDQRVCRENGLAFQALVGPDGRVRAEATPFAGLWFKDADKEVRKDLRQRGLLIKDEQLLHKYPHCWRCKTPLMYFTREAWFIETSRVKERLVALNKTIEWNPEHIRDGRFGGFLANNRDWALSRERYWGTPLPIWECTGCGKPTAVESLDELRRLGANVPADMDPHRPGIDEVTVPRCGACGGGPLKRVKEVVDCWYDSGAMPFAQWGYPHVEGSKARFQANFPADFICEAIDQTRGWFYTLHAIATLIFDRPSYSRCLVLGHTLDAKGKKQSKKDKNYRSPTEVLDAHGADAMRWFFYSKMSPGQGVRYTDEAVRDARGFLLKLLNVYKFFQQYASADGFDPAATPRPSVPSREPLDRWVTSELHSTIAAVRTALEAYEWTQAAQAIETFVDGLSNWYVRRSRDRGWSPATPDNAPKWAFWWTLYEVLTTLSRLLAPFVPFLADELHRVLVRDLDPGSKRSVHLESYPEADADLRDPGLEARMGLARRAVALGSQVRKTAKLNLRQPLGRAVILLSSPREEEDVKALAEVIGDELNVKAVDVSREFDKFVAFDVRVDFKRLGPRFGKRLGAVKKTLEGMDPKLLAASARAGTPVELKVEGATETLAPADLDVRLTAREGFAAAEDRGLVVVLDTHVDAALGGEGLAREVQSRIQGFRKEMALPFEARVEVWVDGADEALQAALESHGEAVRRETLATALRADAPPDADGVRRFTTRVEGRDLVLALRVVP